jgi:hypothetical protein
LILMSLPTPAFGAVEEETMPTPTLVLLVICVSIFIIILIFYAARLLLYRLTRTMSAYT